METSTNTIMILDKYLANSPENIDIPPDADEEIVLEFIDSTMSALEQLESIILACESGKSDGDFAAAARRILHNIKGEAGIMDFAVISSICHQAESLLYDNCQTIPTDKLLAVKDWLTKVMQHLAKTGSKLTDRTFKTQAMKLLASAEIDIFDMDHGTSYSQAIEAISAKMTQIAELANQRPDRQIKDLVVKVLGLLGETQQADQCVISDDDKEALFNQTDAIKQYLLS